MGLRCLELYCGIGGFAAAIQGRSFEVSAIDQSEAALQVYRRNFPSHFALQANLEQSTAQELSGYDLLWLSPPCQPYSVKGARLDIADPRATSFLRLLKIFPEARPRFLALENVEGFAGSRARELLLETLRRCDYHWSERVLCPTSLGIPNRRPRYYLVASTGTLAEPRPLEVRRRALREYLDCDPSPALAVDPSVVERFGPGLRILDPENDDAYATCFTSGYGKAVMRAGSYLRWRGGVRLFSPQEIARLLHFPEDFEFPKEMPLRKKWQLVGNSLSVACVREVLAQIGA